MKTIISARADGQGAPSYARVFAVCGALGLLAGCASEPESVVLTAPPPAPPAAAVYSAPVTVQTPSGGVATVQTPVAQVSPVGASSIVVMQSPPAAHQEVPTARPTADHVWVAGYWTWKNNQYTWVTGQWTMPPRAGAVWVPPRWQPEGASWRFYEGYWD